MTFESLSPNQQRILTEAYEAAPDAIYAGMRADISDYAELSHKGYLTRSMVKSGFSPEYKFFITHEGRKLIYAHLGDK